MTNEANSHDSQDPMELWRDWNEATARMWSSMLDVARDAYGDPHGLSHLWVKSFGAFQEQLKADPTGTLNPVEVWKQWADATTDAWRRAAEAGKDSVKLSDQWLKILEETQAKILSGEINSRDPVTFFKQWYDATNEMWTQVVGEMMNSERFLEANRQFIEAYTNAVKASTRINEEIYQHLQLPSRADIARVAVLVVSLEEKVDKIEDAFENFEESYAQVARSAEVEELAERMAQFEESYTQVARSAEVEELAKRMARLEESNAHVAKSAEVEGLAKRLEQVEGQLSRLLVTMEKIEARGSGEPAGSNGRTQRKTPGRTSRTRQPKTAEEETKSEQ